MLVLVSSFRKDGKLFESVLMGKGLHKYSILGRAGDKTQDLIAVRQRSHKQRQLRRPFTNKPKFYLILAFAINYST